MWGTIQRYVFVFFLLYNTVPYQAIYRETMLFCNTVPVDSCKYGKLVPVSVRREGLRISVYFEKNYD